MKDKRGVVKIDRGCEGQEGSGEVRGGSGQVRGGCDQGRRVYC